MIFIIHAKESELKIPVKELEEQLLSRKMDFSVATNFNSNSEERVWTFRTEDFEELRTFKGIVEGELKIQ